MKTYWKKITAIMMSSAILAGCVYILSLLPDTKEEEKLSPEQSVTINNQNSKGIKTDKLPVVSSSSFTAGVWVPYMSLDLKGTDRSEETARNRLTEIFDRISQVGADTVFLHVRPFGDALYQSELFPASHLLSGEQGKKVNYDFLKIACELARERKLHIHAWINPLRISLDNIPSRLSEDNYYTQWKNDKDKSNDRYTISSGKSIIYNPAYTEVRKLITDGIREIVRNYDIDGIVIDDYFYPEDDMKCDLYEYNLYSKEAGETYLSQKNWRKENINSLLCSMYSAVHYEKKDCVFGISPQCNTENDEKIGADIHAWGEIAGYADYLSPQIYVSENHPTLPFQKSADQWKQIVSNKNIKLYISLALYKEGTDADNGTWLEKENNIESQISYTKAIGADGYVIYSYEDL